MPGAARGGGADLVAGTVFHQHGCPCSTQPVPWAAARFLVVSSGTARTLAIPGKQEIPAGLKGGKVLQAGNAHCRRMVGVGTASVWQSVPVPEGARGAGARSSLVLRPGEHGNRQFPPFISDQCRSLGL